MSSRPTERSNSHHSTYMDAPTVLPVRIRAASSPSSVRINHLPPVQKVIRLLLNVFRAPPIPYWIADCGLSQRRRAKNNRKPKMECNKEAKFEFHFLHCDILFLGGATAPKDKQLPGIKLTRQQPPPARLIAGSLVGHTATPDPSLPSSKELFPYFPNQNTRDTPAVLHAKAN